MSSHPSTERILIDGAPSDPAAGSDQPASGQPASQELVQRVVAAIRSGRRVALPTETVYGVAADPTDAATVARLRKEKGRAQQHHFTVHLARIEDLGALDVDVPANAQRLIDRYWPGPLTLVLPTRDGKSLGVRVPANDFTRAVIGSFDRGLFLTSINRTGEPPLLKPDQIAASGHVDLLVDAGPPRLGLSSCVVGLDKDGIRVLREGVLTEAELLRTAAAEILFVCSGNTCRSPMAEVLAKQALAERLGVPTEQLLAHGVLVRSAGTGAMLDAPASENAVKALAEQGLDGTHHLSTPLDQDALQRADRILCMGRSHLGVIAMALGIADPAELAPRIMLLDPSGKDVADPYGGDLQIYRAARDQIADAVSARLPEFLALARNRDA